MKRIGIMTSGGDSPGMNPFVRAAVRRAIYHGLEVYAINKGYQGLIDGELKEMTERSVSGILDRAGTILETARCEEFKTSKGQRKALRRLNEYGIEGLIVLGGDGSLKGAMALHEQGIKVVGAPGTIDNDMFGTEMTIGVDTALNVALNLIDMIRATASSHRRAFLVEVMGRHCGYLALMVGIASGAEMICIPEKDFTMDDVINVMEDAYIRGKSHCIIVVAEGAKYSAQDIQDFVAQSEDIDFDVRTSILGHVQRGGTPTAFERILATRLGCAAADCLKAGKTGVMVGTQGHAIITTPIPEVVNNKKKLDLTLYEMAASLENPVQAGQDDSL